MINKKNHFYVIFLNKIRSFEEVRITDTFVRVIDIVRIADTLRRKYRCR